MKANQDQYEAAIEIYGKNGTASVFDYAKEIVVDEWSSCNPCDKETPDCQFDNETICKEV